jgi:hypothetical protein
MYVECRKRSSLTQKKKGSDIKMDDQTTKAKHGYYDCITGLVRCTGKYIAEDDYTDVL